MKTPINMRINEDCELSGYKLPTELFAVLERSDALFQAMRENRQPTPRFVRISAQAKRDLIDWSRRYLDYRPVALLWRGLPVIGPQDKSPFQQSVAA